MNRMGWVQSVAQFDDFDFLVGPAGRMEEENDKDENKDN
jgi:hypothetical protein